MKDGVVGIGRHFYWQKPLISYPQPAGPVRERPLGGFHDKCRLSPARWRLCYKHQEIGDRRATGEAPGVSLEGGERKGGVMSVVDYDPDIKYSFPLSYSILKLDTWSLILLFPQ